MTRVPFSFLLRRTYTDTFDGWGDMDFTDYGRFATCDYCGWDSHTFLTEREAQRARWRHPDVLCWLRAFWIDSRMADCLHRRSRKANKQASPSG